MTLRIPATRKIVASRILPMSIICGAAFIVVLPPF
jgi:hypothetical protein